MVAEKRKEMDEKYCSSCGEIIKKEAEICVKCGVRQKSQGGGEVSSNWLTAVLLCFFLGYLGVHRFYLGKTGTGILMILTLGGCGVWTLIDFILLVMGKFTDSNGNLVKRV